MLERSRARSHAIETQADATRDNSGSRHVLQILHRLDCEPAYIEAPTAVNETTTGLQRESHSQDKYASSALYIF